MVVDSSFQVENVPIEEYLPTDNDENYDKEEES
jgi:hypothetical protein